MKNTLTLCVTRSAIAALIPEELKLQFNVDGGIIPVNLQEVDSRHLHLINRSVADYSMPSRGTTLPESEYHQHRAILNAAQTLPHLIGYAVLEHQGKYLTYARPSSGTEERLHGKRSLGIGGHIDSEDATMTSLTKSIISSTHREIFEETNLMVGVNQLKLDKIIIDNSNEVGSVHIGVLVEVHLKVIDIYQPSAELLDAKWMTAEEILADINEYENWSQIVANNIFRK